MTAGMVYLVQLAPPAFLGQQTPSLAVTHLIRGVRQWSRRPQ
jgi:hypothetical protein